METLKISIRPLTAFGGEIRGDTLFGQFCWAIVHRYGAARLTELLDGYTDGSPFLVCSDAFPLGHVHRPALPLACYQPLAHDEVRKRVKQRRWLPVEAIAHPVEAWLSLCRSDKELAQIFATGTDDLSQLHPQPHNSIHRGLNTTCGGEFAPYTLQQSWFAPDLLLDIWLLYDQARLNAAQLVELASDIGSTGYGRDVTVGLGKYRIEATEETMLPRHETSNAGVTLAPCAPQGLGFDAVHSYYEPFVRFGRHGDRAVLSGKPFKNPLLLANTGAVLVGAKTLDSGFIGQGLGGGGSLSNVIPETVHQGYAPGIGVLFSEADA